MRPRMSAAERRAAGVESAPLSGGETRFRWAGGTRGPVLVCIHGLTTPSGIWDGLVPVFARLGFRVLSYDLYGRGFSDRPVGPQTPDFFADQLEELLDHLGVDADVTLAGYSMGAVIAARVAARSPHRVRSLVLIAPAGMEITLDGLTRFARDWPWIGDWLFHLRFPRTHPERAADIVHHGYLASVLSSLRNSLRRPREADHRAIAAAGLPVVAIWAREDRVIPLSSLGRLAQWNRAVRHEVIEGAGHDLPRTHAAELDAVLTGMLSRPD